MLTEIRFLSRGGQGGVTGAKMLAYAGFLEKYQVQAIPKYGAERKGAALFTDIRIADEPILTHAPVIGERARIWVILDPAVIAPVKQIQEGAIVVINTTGKDIPEYLLRARGTKKLKLAKVDAQKIAREFDLVKSGTAMVNTVMLGATARASGLIKLESLEKSIFKTFGKTPLAERNINAINKAYNSLEWVE
ncbi:MAG: 2-oxoacid:acceptor oxidoreductase family protein [Candidatus Hodarchaeales archaeon]